MLTISERPLSSAELSNLSRRLKTARIEGRSAFMARVLGSALLWVFLVLFTVASGTPAWVAIPFWSSIVVPITWWRHTVRQRSMDERTATLDQAVRRNLARASHVQAARVIEFEKDDYEGVCYAFEIDDDSSLFIVGDAIAAGDNFPNSDFSIVEILVERGRPIDTIVEKRGVTLTPVAVIPNATKSLMVVPEHMSLLPLALDRITEGLPHRRR